MIFININIYNVIFIKISDMLDFYKYQGGCPAPGGRVVIFIKLHWSFIKIDSIFIKLLGYL